MRDPIEVIAALRALLAKATPGEWMLATSCSWRRILTTGGKPVIVPTTQRSDNHPDMDCGDNYANAELAIAAVNALPELLAIAEAAEDLRAECAQLREELAGWESDFDTQASHCIELMQEVAALKSAAALSTVAPVRDCP